MIDTNSAPSDVPCILNNRFYVDVNPIIKEKENTAIYDVYDFLSPNPLVPNLVVKIVKNNMDLVSHEISIMQLLDSPDIMAPFDAIKIKELNAIAIIMPKMKTDMFNYIEYNGKLSEIQAATAFYAIARGLYHMHEKQIVHCDVKLENIFVKRETNGIIEAILGDLDLSCALERDEMITERKGTFYYFAPEIMNEMPYSYPADVWAFAVALYYAVTERWLFDLDKNNYASQVVSGVSDNDERFDCISPSLKSLLIRCLAVDPTQRPTFAEILDDEWFFIRIIQ
jgi:calcium/calmodulin-dependent protein kinase I